MFRPASGIVQPFSLSTQYMYSSWPQDIMRLEMPHPSLYMPLIVLNVESFKSGFSLKESKPKTHASDGAQPTGKVSPTTAHCSKAHVPATFGKANTFPISCNKPTR